MKKQNLILTGILLLMILPSVLSINLNVNRISSDQIMIPGISEPTVFEIEVQNNGDMENFEMYNLIGFKMSPKKITIPENSLKVINISLYPKSLLEQRGLYSLTYHIKNELNEKQEEELVFRIIPIEKSFETSVKKIFPNSSNTEITISNKYNHEFRNLTISSNSKFFSFEKTIDLKEYGNKTISIPINKEIKSLKAGFYTVNFNFKKEEVKGQIDESVNFAESNIFNLEKSESGLIINKQKIEKINQGNTVKTTQTTIEKNILSRLFTTFSPEADTVKREGFMIYYTWIQTIGPGESSNIIVTTNWIIPFVILILIVVITVLVKKYSEKDLDLRKKVSFVKSKSGDFALKISIFIQSKKHLKNISVIDKYPAMVKLYEKYGTKKPTSIDKKKRRVKWDFENLEEGETRVVSYIVYSKLGVLGKFALPKTEAIYEKEDKVKESFSNRAYFVTDQVKRKEI